MDGIDMEPWGAVEPLLLAACSGRAQLLATVEAIGLESTTDIVVGELHLRCDPPQLNTPVQVQLEVTCDTRCAGRVITIGPTGVISDPGWTNKAVATIRFDVVDLVRSLFGPLENRSHTSREVRWSDGLRPSLGSYLATDSKSSSPIPEWAAPWSVTHALLWPSVAGLDDLRTLSVRYMSDKWAVRWYAQYYEQHFSRLRNEPIRLLEIGVGGYDDPDKGGASMRMWQRYFHRGLVYGLDIFDKPRVRGPRMRAIQGDQNDPRFLENLGRQLGPFDIVIDDGSHINEHVKTSFRALFPHVRASGLYVIEDLEKAYMPTFGGDSHDLNNSDTSLGMLKALVDGLNYEEIPSDVAGSPSYTDRHVTGLHFHHNLAIVEKGYNAEGSIVDFIHASVR